jgi:hypothetical protein
VGKTPIRGSLRFPRGNVTIEPTECLGDSQTPKYAGDMLAPLYHSKLLCCLDYWQRNPKILHKRQNWVLVLIESLREIVGLSSLAVALFLSSRPNIHLTFWLDFFADLLISWI